MPSDHAGHFTDRPGDLTVGILGGMGPHATADLLRVMVALTPAGKDWDHLHIIVDNNPRMPSRTRAFLFGEASPAPYLVAGARRLEAMGAAIIVVPCNSASYYLAPVREAVRARLIDPVGATAAAIASERVARRPLVLGGIVTARAGLYGAALAPHGIATLLPDAEGEAEVADLIECLKRLDTGDAVVARTRAVIERGRAAGADSIILGCTEFGLIAGALADDLPVYNSNEILARAAVEQARGG
jgi:aspartate racemase